MMRVCELFIFIAPPLGVMGLMGTVISPAAFPFCRAVACFGIMGAEAWFVAIGYLRLSDQLDLDAWRFRGGHFLCIPISKALPLRHEELMEKDAENGSFW